jgi:hypothetical protein
MKRISQLSILSLLIISCGGREFPEVVNVDSLAQTDFVGTLDEKVKPGQNQIYCSTLPYAWFEVREGLKSKIKTESKPINKLLEANDYQSSLHSNEIWTSFERIEDKIKATAQFTKSLPFEFEFERNNTELEFETTAIHSFGINGYDEYDITNQIELIYYKSDDEFALKLLPEDSNHEIYIYLPKKTKFKTLKQLVNDIEKSENKRSKRQSENKLTWQDQFLDDDLFSMPVLEFNIEKNYANIEGQNITAGDTTYTIETCYQRIAFILDEVGAVIESEVLVEMATEAAPEEFLPQPKQLLLNQPFFIMLKRTDSDNPYLAMWINNTELMVEK